MTSSGEKGKTPLLKHGGPTANVHTSTNVLDESSIGIDSPSSSSTEFSPLLNARPGAKSPLPDSLLKPRDQSGELEGKCAAWTWLRVVPSIIICFIGVGFQSNVVPQQSVEFFRDRAMIITSTFDGLASFMAFLSAPVVGFLSDRIGRKYVIMSCIFLMNLPTLPLIFTENLWFYVLLRPLAGIGQTVLCVSFAYAADWVPEHRLSTAFGTIAGMVSMTFIFSPMLGAAVYKWADSPRDVWLVAGVITAAGMVYTALFVPDKKRTKPDPAEHPERRRSLNPIVPVMTLMKGNRTLKLLTLAMFLHSCMFMGFMGSLPMYFVQYMHFDNFTLALSTGYMGVLMTASQVLTNPVSSRLGKRTPFFLAALGGALICLGETFSRTQAQCFFAVTAMVIMGMVTPTVCSEAARLSPPGAGGATQGALAAVRSVAEGTSPVILARLLNLSNSYLGHASYGYLWTLMYAAGLLAVAVILPRGLAEAEANVMAYEVVRDEEEAQGGEGEESEAAKLARK